ncbi:hypothetical protein EI94DRAFT_626836 [Lactarius quietus]|nr:hypothetical protein EI94DRAFT_626836 [Lactarius quietus]
MVSWIQDFSNTYHPATTRFLDFRIYFSLSRYRLLHSCAPALVIYTTTSWWEECTGNSAAFGSISPLWIASWGSSIGTLSAGWSYTTFWKFADSDTFPGDQDSFNGDAAGLSRYVSQCICLYAFARRTNGVHVLVWLWVHKMVGLFKVESDSGHDTCYELPRT